MATGLYKVKLGSDDNYITNLSETKHALSVYIEQKIKELEVLHPEMTRDDIIKHKLNKLIPPISQLNSKLNMPLINTFKKSIPNARDTFDLQALGNKHFGTTATFVIKLNELLSCHAISDMYFVIKLSEAKMLRSTDGIRYVARLAHALIKQVKMTLNGLEYKYSGELYNWYYDRIIELSRKQSYLECIGQETTSNTFLVGNPAVEEFTIVGNISEGEQTFKNKQGDVTMYVPLLFWFREYGQCIFTDRFSEIKIDVEFNTLDKLVSLSIDPDNDNPVNRGNYIEPRIHQFDVRITREYIDSSIYKIYKTISSSQLIRIYKTASFSLNKTIDSIKISSMFEDKVEAFYVGIRPKRNTEHSQTWFYNNYLMTPKYMHKIVPVYADNPIDEPSTDEDNAGATQHNYAIFFRKSPVIKQIGMTANNIEIFANSCPKYYINYVSSTDEKQQIDSNWMYFPFNTQSNHFQPTGYFDVAKNGDVYVNYEAMPNMINVQNPAEMIVIAVTLNYFTKK